LTNETIGGDGTRGLKWRQESRDKLSRSKTGVPASEAAKKSLRRNWHLKHPSWTPTDETKKKMSQNSPRYWLHKKMSKKTKLLMSRKRKTYLQAQPEVLQALKTLRSGKGPLQRVV
jgi:hypothetical protein